MGIDHENKTITCNYEVHYILYHTATERFGRQLSGFPEKTFWHDDVDSASKFGSLLAVYDWIIASGRKTVSSKIVVVPLLYDSVIVIYSDPYYDKAITIDDCWENCFDEIIIDLSLDG